MPRTGAAAATDNEEPAAREFARLAEGDECFKISRAVLL
jgi:hypothetical protein